MLLLVTKGGNIKGPLKLAGILLGSAWQILYSNQLTVRINATNNNEREVLGQLSKAVTLTSSSKT